eukprot:6373744-Pyramimonas_sp.AAC.1
MFGIGRSYVRDVAVSAKNTSSNKTGPTGRGKQLPPDAMLNYLSLTRSLVKPARKEPRQKGRKSSDEKEERDKEEAAKPAK